MRFINSDLISVFAVIFIAALFFLPITPAILDLLLVANIYFSLFLLVRSVWEKNTSVLFSFPKFLLGATLLRLALNIASTRLILLHGHEGSAVAGRVIESFGRFIVEGNFVVGTILFAVIAIVNFLVVAKGAARVAEVAARFTLDAMPGKQLTIDSDFRAGSISHDEAGRRRDYLNIESQFYGSMDGAMKFVQGDAIATLLIVLLNSAGGVLIGLSRGMDYEVALSTFGVLAVGDGLVSIIPALFVSVGSGFVVTALSSTPASANSSTGLNQLKQYSPLFFASVAIMIFGLLPNFPFWPFFAVSSSGFAVLIFQAYKRRIFHPYQSTRFSGFEVVSAHPTVSAELQHQFLIAGNHSSRAESESEDFSQGLLLELSSTLFSDELNIEEAESFWNCYESERLRLFQKRGVLIPRIKLVSAPSLAPEEFRISLKEISLYSGEIDKTMFYVNLDKPLLKILGISGIVQSKLPSFIATSIATSGSLVPVKYLPLLQPSVTNLGAIILNDYQLLASIAVGCAAHHLEDFFGLNETKEQYVELLAEKIISPGELLSVLRRLIREGINISECSLIQNAIIEFHAESTEIEDRSSWLKDLYVQLRISLRKSIVSACTGAGDELRVFQLSEEVSSEFQNVLSAWPGGKTRVPFEPDFAQALKARSEALFAPPLARGVLPIVVLCHDQIRAAVSEFYLKEGYNPEQFKAISFEEIDGGLNFSSLNYDGGLKGVGVLSIP
jgi:flagellar biosynthesis component FlhA